MRKLWLFLAVLFFCASCQALDATQAVPTLREESLPVPSETHSPTVRPSPTQTPTPLPSPTVTISPSPPPSPTSTIQPTITNTPYPTEDLSRAIAKNEVAALVNDEVEIEILRIFIADRAGLIYLGGKVFEDKQTVFEIIFRVRNGREEVVMIDLFRSQIWVNNTVIDFGAYRLGSGPVPNWIINDEFFDEAIAAGRAKTGGMIVGIDQPAWDQVSGITVWVPAAFDMDGRAVTESFTFRLDPSEWGFDPLTKAMEKLPRQGGVY